MPYYVYAIHTDSTINRLYDSLDDLKKAEALEKRMMSGNYPGDNYFVQMIYAENDKDAKQKINAIRKERNLPVSKI